MGKKWNNNNGYILTPSTFEYIGTVERKKEKNTDSHSLSSKSNNYYYWTCCITARHYLFTVNWLKFTIQSWKSNFSSLDIDKPIWNPDQLSLCLFYAKAIGKSFNSLLSIDQARNYYILLVLCNSIKADIGYLEKGRTSTRNDMKNPVWYRWSTVKIIWSDFDKI